MPVMEGVEVVRRLRERDPRARVIVLTTYDTDEEISRALKAGAKAYVLKDISADDLVTCIRDVLAGKTYLAPAAAAKLAEDVTRVQLTPRELATLRLMADGKSNKEIANELGISDRTVKTHLGHLFEKLSCRALAMVSSARSSGSHRKRLPTRSVTHVRSASRSAHRRSVPSACGCRWPTTDAAFRGSARPRASA